ncbi:MAG: hypothetical protein ABL971_00055 [Vicinamibacterales bacterium]
MLEQARRERPVVLTALPAGVTDLRMLRVLVADGVNKVTIQAR